MGLSQRWLLPQKANGPDWRRLCVGVRAHGGAQLCSQISVIDRDTPTPQVTNNIVHGEGVGVGH